MSWECCLAQQVDKMCFLFNVRYHRKRIGDIKELLKKLHAFRFNYQHVGCLYTFLKYQFSGKTFAKSRQLFDNVQRAVYFNYQNNRVDRFLRKKYEKPLLSSIQESKTTPTSESVFADRTEQVKKNKFEKEVVKVVDCFLDGRGNYTSNLVSFKIISL